MTSELEELKAEIKRLRTAGMYMQIAVAKVLQTGGTDINTWFESLAEAQRKLASATKGTRAEFDIVRAEKQSEEDARKKRLKR